MLTAVVLTKNEAQNLPRCLASLKFCDHILVIDDDSTDDTVKIAKKFGAEVILHPLNSDFSAQRNFALSKSTNDWTLFVDADEEVSPELAAHIPHIIRFTSVQGFYLNRFDVLWGQVMQHGDARTGLLRLGRTQAGQWQGVVHETWGIPGRVESDPAPLMHYPHPSLVEFLRHLNTYSSLRAAELRSQNYHPSLWEVIFLPKAKFLHLWIWKLGFLDGTRGFISAMLMAFYTFMTRAKLWLSYSS